MSFYRSSPGDFSKTQIASLLKLAPHWVHVHLNCRHFQKAALKVDFEMTLCILNFP